MKRISFGWSLIASLVMSGAAVAQDHPSEHPKPQPESVPVTPEPAPDAAPKAPYDGPSAKEIIEKSIEACGGRAAYEKITNRVTIGAMEIPMQGLKGQMSMTQAAPNKMLMKFDMGGFGSQTQGTDGDIVWSVDTMQGARILEGDERKNLLQQAMLNAELKWEEIYTDAKAEAVEEVNGSPAYLVTMIGPDGQKISNYYDKASGMLVKTATMAKTPMGEIPMDSQYFDYREIGGIKLAHRTVITSAMGMQIIMTLDSVKVNEDLPPDTFAIPEEVKKVMEASNAAPAPAPTEEKPKE